MTGKEILNRSYDVNTSGSYKNTFNNKVMTWSNILVQRVKDANLKALTIQTRTYATTDGKKSQSYSESKEKHPLAQFHARQKQSGKDYITSYTGTACYDFDKIKPEHLQKVVDALSRSPYVAYIFYGTNHLTGLHVFSSITEAKDEQEFKELYQFLGNHLNSLILEAGFNYSFDTQCNEGARRFHISHGKPLHENLEAVTSTERAPVKTKNGTPIQIKKVSQSAPSEATGSTISDIKRDPRMMDVTQSILEGYGVEFTEFQSNKYTGHVDGKKDGGCQIWCNDSGQYFFKYHNDSAHDVDAFDGLNLFDLYMEHHGITSTKQAVKELARELNIPRKKKVKAVSVPVKKKYATPEQMRPKTKVSLKQLPTGDGKTTAVVMMDEEKDILSPVTIVTDQTKKKSESKGTLRAYTYQSGASKPTKSNLELLVMDEIHLLPRWNFLQKDLPHVNNRIFNSQKILGMTATLQPELKESFSQVFGSDFSHESIRNNTISPQNIEVHTSMNCNTEMIKTIKSRKQSELADVTIAWIDNIKELEIFRQQSESLKKFDRVVVFDSFKKDSEDWQYLVNQERIKMEKGEKVLVLTTSVAITGANINNECSFEYLAKCSKNDPESFVQLLGRSRKATTVKVHLFVSKSFKLEQDKRKYSDSEVTSFFVKELSKERGSFFNTVERGVFIELPKTMFDKGLWYCQSSREFKICPFGVASLTMDIQRKYWSFENWKETTNNYGNFNFIEVCASDEDVQEQKQIEVEAKKRRVKIKKEVRENFTNPKCTLEWLQLFYAYYHSELTGSKKSRLKEWIEVEFNIIKDPHPTVKNHNYTDEHMEFISEFVSTFHSVKRYAFDINLSYDGIREVISTAYYEKGRTGRARGLNGLKELRERIGIGFLMSFPNLTSRQVRDKNRIQKNLGSELRILTYSELYKVLLKLGHPIKDKAAALKLIRKYAHVLSDYEGVVLVKPINTTSEALPPVRTIENDAASEIVRYKVRAKKQGITYAPAKCIEHLNTVLGSFEPTYELEQLLRA